MPGWVWSCYLRGSTVKGVRGVKLAVRGRKAVCDWTEEDVQSRILYDIEQSRLSDKPDVKTASDCIEGLFNTTYS